MKKLFLILCIFPAALFGDQFFHLDLGSVGGFPAVGGGYRYQQGFVGADISAKALPSIVYSAQGIGLLYPTAGGLYLGAGGGYSRDCYEKDPVDSPTINGVVGYQRKDKWFIQAEGTSLIKKPQLTARTYPSITLGLCF